MNKGLVMEKHRKYTIVLTKDGMFQKATPVPTADIGDEVDFEPYEEKQRNWGFLSLGKIGMPVRVGMAVAILLLLAIPLYVLPGRETQTYAYVSIDINPSIELQIDDSLHVKKLTPLNADAKVLIKHLGTYKGEDLDEVVNSIMQKSEERDLIANGKRMLVGVSYAEGTQNRKVSVLEHLRQFFMKDANEWKVATYRIPIKVRKLAQEEKTSANELLAQKMMDPDSDAAESVSDEDKAMIHSFYRKKETDEEKADKKSKQDIEDSDKQTEQHINDTKRDQKPVSEKRDTSNTEQTQKTVPPASKQTVPNTHSDNSNANQQSNQDQNKSYNNPYKNNQEQYNHKQYDYKNNNPYRNKHNEYQNRGEQYRQQHSDKDDDDEDED